MTVSCTIQVKGHIIDSLTLTKITDLIIGSGSEYKMNELEIGRKETDTSSVNITINSGTRDELDRIVAMTAKHGATLTKEPAHA